MDFALICRDGRDALQRRLAARVEHMAGLKTGKTDGTIVDGGAILDDEGNMVGSVVLCRFQTAKPSMPISRARSMRASKYGATSKFSRCASLIGPN